MTIPQIVSAVGWFLCVIGVLGTGLHALNQFMPNIDFYIATAHLGNWPYLITIPVAVVGLVTGFGGAFAEQIEERWLNQGRDD
jgi:hypothetical protein